MQFSYLVLLKFPLLPSFVKESNSVCHLISSKFDKCPERLIMSIMAKPYIVQNISLHWICSKVQHGHNCFLNSNLMKGVRGQKHLSEAKNLHERVDLLRKILNKRCLTTLKPQRVYGSSQIWVCIAICIALCISVDESIEKWSLNFRFTH